MIAVCAEGILILRDTYRLLQGEESLSGTKLEEKNKEKQMRTSRLHTENTLICPSLLKSGKHFAQKLI